MPVKFFRVRVLTGTNYHTRDNKFRVHQEYYPPRRWFVCQKDDEDGSWGDACPHEGFETLNEARVWLGRRYDAEKYTACAECNREAEKDELTDGVCDECAYSEECEVCDGTGMVDAEDPKDVTQDCDECGGTGQR